jgi:RNA polymerase sigma-70 factor (ECF subfamily)
MRPGTGAPSGDEPFPTLLAAAKAADPEALGWLWRHHNPRLVRYLHAVAPDGADDTASEVWLRAARRLHGFDGDDSDFRAWLFTIARNLVLDRTRQASRRPAHLAEGAELDDLAAPQDTAAEALERLGTEQALSLIAQLPSAQAEVVLLRVVAGLDVSRVATLLGKRAGTVRVIQHRALRALAKRVAEQTHTEHGAVTP